MGVIKKEIVMKMKKFTLLALSFGLMTLLRGWSKWFLRKPKHDYCCGNHQLHCL